LEFCCRKKKYIFQAWCRETDRFKTFSTLNMCYKSEILWTITFTTKEDQVCRLSHTPRLKFLSRSACSSCW
jgi:hypothetical protein